MWRSKSGIYLSILAYEMMLGVLKYAVNNGSISDVRVVR